MIFSADARYCPLRFRSVASHRSSVGLPALSAVDPKANPGFPAALSASDISVSRTAPCSPSFTYGIVEVSSSATNALISLLSSSTLSPLFAIVDSSPTLGSVAAGSAQEDVPTSDYRSVVDNSCRRPRDRKLVGSKSRPNHRVFARTVPRCTPNPRALSRAPSYRHLTREGSDLRPDGVGRALTPPGGAVANGDCSAWISAPRLIANCGSAEDDFEVRLDGCLAGCSSMSLLTPRRSRGAQRSFCHTL